MVIELKGLISRFTNYQYSLFNIHVYYNNKELTEDDAKIGKYYKIQDGSKLTAKGVLKEVNPVIQFLKHFNFDGNPISAHMQDYLTIQMIKDLIYELTNQQVDFPYAYLKTCIKNAGI